MRPECAHSVDVGSNLIVVFYRLGIVGCEYELRGWQLGEAGADPFAPLLGGTIGARPSAAIIEQSMVQIIIEWHLRLPPVPRNGSCAHFLALLEPEDAGEISRDSPGKMRHLNRQGWKLVEQVSGTGSI